MKPTASERLYRKLLKAYPAAYRQAYGERMAQLFRDQLRDAGEGLPLARLWMRTLPDWVRTVCEQHAEMLRPSASGGATVVFARYEAEAYGHAGVTAEDLLLGALRADREFPGDTAEAIRAALGPVAGRRSGLRVRVPFTAECRRILQRAEREAGVTGVHRTKPRDILAGILLEEQTLAARLLREHGIDLPRVRNR